MARATQTVRVRSIERAVQTEETATKPELKTRNLRRIYTRARMPRILRGIPGGLVNLGVPTSAPLALPSRLDGGVYAHYMCIQFTLA